MYSDQRLVHCTCERFYGVVADVQSYPQFVPGWLAVRTSPHGEQCLNVEQYVQIGPVHRWIRSRAWFEPPHRISVQPTEVEGAGLALEWRFRAHDGGCEIVLEVCGHATSRLLAAALDAMAEHAARRLLDVFAARAQALGGHPCPPGPVNLKG